MYTFKNIQVLVIPVPIFFSFFLFPSIFNFLVTANAFRHIIVTDIYMCVCVCVCVYIYIVT